MRKTSLFLLFVLAAALFRLNAEEKKGQATPPPLQHEIVVSATRIETPAKEIASSVTVITRRDLEATKKPTVLEALGNVMGIAVIQNGGPGSAASAFIRGGNSEHILVLLDGVEVNDPINPSRSYDLAHLSIQNVEQIEVLRGPQSTLYGSDALSGVINILTRKGGGKPRLTLSAQGGSLGTLAGAMELAGSAGAVNYSLGLSRFSDRGVSAASRAYAGNEEKDGYRNLSFSGRLGFTFKNNIESAIIVRTVSAQSDIDNFGGPRGDDPNNTQDYKSVFLRAQFRGLFAGNRWEQKLGLSFIRSRRLNDNPVDTLHPYDSEKGTYKSGLMKLDWQNNIFADPANTLTLGLDVSREQGESSYTSLSLFGPYESPFPRKTADKEGVYVQDQVRIAGRFFATIGGRLDRHSTAGTALTYRLAPSYLIDRTRTRFKASIGTGFKSPSLYQLYAPATFWGLVGNGNLKPEQSRGWDLGIEQLMAGESLLLGLEYYHSDFRNLIDFDFSRGYINIGRAMTRGIEAYGEVQIGERVRGKASYTRLEAKDLDAGADLLRRPKEKISAVLDWAPIKNSALNVSAVYTGRRSDKDFSGLVARDVTLKGYLVLDASLSLDLSVGAQLFVRIENLLDARYETVFGYGTPSFSAYAGFKVGLFN